MRLILLTIAIMLGVASLCYGEYFKYVDENGVVSFTDNPLILTEKQREQAQSFKSTAPKPDTPHQEKVSGDNEKTGSETYEEESDPVAEYKKAKELKASLDQTYEKINKEREELAAQQNKLKSDADIKSFNIKAKALNEKIKFYKQKKEEYLNFFSNTPSKSAP